ncbi:exodeoxyribonuclease VII large subunit [Candidatus Woesearchaeota archaeon]|jgi:aspartyl/asparaginyl-tRNA synthetase|nr:exodeoxyribonuclease VII large subunit [Candidatus Woesearchaeota archaeon]MBT7062454.1 exodeoxyribonuclease VII large subunit [Candidatus Woesearchaeota archaeon]MBT7402969.1 exodeoxyribonuclease VII large subunit [Candidatus Woesearchaeota archaeon]
MSKKLLGFALVFSLIGLLSLIVLAEFTELEQVNVAELENKVEQRIIIEGAITSSFQKADVNFFDLKDKTGEIKVVAFGNMLKLKKGSEVRVQGLVKIYQGELEIIADKIILTS